MKSIRNSPVYTRRYLFFIVLVVLLCYGFTLTHFSIGIDDEAFGIYFTNNGMITQGRWVSYLIKKVFDWYTFLPFWRDFIALLLMAAGTAIWSVTFWHVSKQRLGCTPVIIFSCVSLSFPYIADLFVFMMTTTEIGVVWVLSGVCLWHFYKMLDCSAKRLDYILPVLWICLGVAASETMMVYLLAGVCFLFLLHAFYQVDSLPIKKYLFSFAVIILIFVLGMLLSQCVLAILLHHLNMQTISYVGDFIQYDLSDVRGLASAFINTLQSLFTSHLAAPADVPTKVFALGSWLLLLCTAIQSLLRKTPIFILLGMMTVGASLSLPLLTGNIDLPNRVFITFSLFLGCVFLYIYVSVCQLATKRVQKCLTSIVCITVLLIVFYQSKEMNIKFFTDYKRYQLDLNVMNQIMLRVDAVTPGKEKKPVVFLGTPDYYNFDVNSVGAVSVFIWDRLYNSYGEFEATRIYNFANMLGYDLTPPQQADEDLIRTQVSSMPIWPAEGSVKDWGDHIIVKLGTPSYEKFELSRSDFYSQFSSGTYEIGGNCDYFDLTDGILNAYGWGAAIGVDSRQVDVTAGLVSDEVQYLLQSDVNLRPDVTAYYADGVDYNYSGFNVHSVDTRRLSPGTYDMVCVVTNGTGVSEIVPLYKQVVIDLAGQ